MSWRRAAHDWSLLIFAALGAYLVQVLVAGAVAAPLVRLSEAVEGRWVSLGLGLLLDLSKLFGLLPLAWLMAPFLQLRPLIAAAGLVLLVLGLELLVLGLVQPLDQLWRDPWLVIGRMFGQLVLIVPVYLIVRRRGGFTGGAGGGDSPQR